MSFAQEIFSESGGELQEKSMSLVQSNLIACLGAIRQNDYDKAKIYFRQTLELWAPEIDLAGAEEEVITPTIFARRFLISKTLGAAYAFLTDEYDKALFYLEAAAKEDPADQEVKAWLNQLRKQIKLNEKKHPASAPQNSEQLLKLAMMVILFLLVVIAVLGIFAILALRSETQGSANASLVSNVLNVMPNFTEGSQASKMAGLPTISGALSLFSSTWVGKPRNLVVWSDARSLISFNSADHEG